MKHYNTTALVLKSKAYKDADKLYTLLTLDSGKVIAVARGVRKIASRRAGNLDTLNHVEIKISKGISGFNNIEEVKLLESFGHIKNSLEVSLQAYYLAELSLKTTQEEEKTPVYKLLYLCLSLLNNPDFDKELVVIFFELNLLFALGYSLNLSHCASCGRKVALDWQHYKFNIDQGGLICDRCLLYGLTISQKAVFALLKIKNQDFTLNLDANILQEIHTLLREFLHEHYPLNLKSLNI